ncbi:DNA polymerase III subunit gamma/tau [Deinococcus sp. Arct2-2]|uniref:DNA polymerase III subunit gamma/tau n=1 Tax=Deinococcus sp. Arct2-2 TaxID=2568653 RepID=UPI0010A2B9CE|nr:DNA polymerase III subunit gamma/tau [Deinococcus sp. Arct2-2]THF69084.1 DNA polymerase III subunit gamma/tau [Deinococcus sp. Arct2-2]
MSAIYQRARPIRWDEVVGQEHVKDVLRAALEQGRVGHAYLFSGPRGVGKTTTARLIAMTANCTGPSPKPCGECESCLSVRSGNHPDVLEIDAASNNSVDDVRDLREKVGLAAMRGGKKIYILDEAHMMTRNAFNALLKTLEEPPSHVIFILATTEPEKIIPTILSRCQHYRFRRLTPEEIAGKLAGLAQKEGMNADPDALQLIGRLADGAMRDGESLLERMLAAGTAVTRAAVEDALGLPPSERVRGIASALMLGDAGGAIQGAGQLYRDGFAARTVVEGLVAAFGLALHAELGLGGEKMDGADVPRLLKLQAALDEQDSRFARSADGLSLELALTHALLAADAGGGGIASASAGRTQTAAAIPADMTQRLNRLEKELASLKAGGARVATSGPAVADFDPGARQSVGARSNGPAPVREAVNAALEDLEEAAPAAVQGSWAEVTRQASMQLRAFLKPARTHAEAGFVSLTYDDKNAFHAKQVVSKYDELAALVLRVFGPVAFELVTPEGTKRQKMGAGGINTGAMGTGAVAQAVSTPAPARAKAAASPTPTPAASIPPASEVPAFQPTRTQRPATTPAPSNPATSNRGPEFAPIDTAPVASKPVQNVAVQPAPRTAPIATIEPPAARVHQRSSPDDVAAAPLPELDPAPWEAEHVADAPPAPSDAGSGDRITPVGASRELYIVEAITEEPDWGDVGGEFQAQTPQGSTAQSSTSPPSLDDAPYASFMPERAAPAPRPDPVPKLTPPELKATPLKAAPGRPADIRAHPIYEEIKGRFSGRVREIGKNRNPASVVAETDGEDEDVGEV